MLGVRSSTISVSLLLLFVTRASTAQVLDTSTLTKYLDPLPIPDVLSPSGTLDGYPLYELPVTQFQQQLHSELPPTTLWGYGGTFPGPTFEVNRDETIKVRWINNLSDNNGDPVPDLLPVDTTIHGTTQATHGGHGSGHPLAQARMVTHVHGAVTDEASDGFPEHWVSPDPDAPANGLGGPAGNSILTTFTNNQRAAGNWYHDHTMGITRLNVYAGMAGLYNIRDAEEQSLNLPSGDYEIPLLLQDRSFYEDGELFYPAGPGDLATPGEGDPLAGLPDEFPSDASVVPRFFADANLVNGKVWPYLEVEPRKYRLRLLNGANSRAYDLSLEPLPGASNTDPVPFHQIGTDSGLLASTSERNIVSMLPADRVDTVVDFSDYAPGDKILMRNLAQMAQPGTTDEVMELRVVPSTGPDDSSLPMELSSFDRYEAEDAVRIRTLTLDRVFDEYGRQEFLLDEKKWTDANTETVVRGEMEIWEFVNNTNMAHPMHMHMEAFQVLSREDPTGNDVPLEDYELGFEDTVSVGPRETVRIMVRFDQYTGTFVWHCHILEHEDLEMMRTFRIVDPGDYNQDGTVDMADYALWKNSLGDVGDDLAADGNNNGVVDAADFTIWRDHFATPDLANQLAPVPEPATAGLLAMAVVGLWRTYGRRAGSPHGG